MAALLGREIVNESGEEMDEKWTSNMHLRNQALRKGRNHEDISSIESLSLRVHSSTVSYSSLFSQQRV